MGKKTVRGHDIANRFVYSLSTSFQMCCQFYNLPYAGLFLISVHMSLSRGVFWHGILAWCLPKYRDYCYTVCWNWLLYSWA